MEFRAFGKTELKVSVPGFGAGGIGDPALSEKEAELLLHSILDAGINLFDTARSYGLSEERIGKYMKHRRKELVLSTKVGYGIPGYQDWTGPCITAGIDHALKLLQTEMIDLVHLHSCPLTTLKNGEVVEALQRGVQQGKVGIAAYSGDNEPLEWALQSGKFGGGQTSVNICDQRIIPKLTAAQESGIGIIAKRPMANTPWRYPSEPADEPAIASYWRRWKQMNLAFAGISPAELALRFVAYLPQVTTLIIGSRNADHLRENISMIGRGPLPDDVLTSIRTAFQENDDDWIGQI